jgi:hypothetical protein
VSLSAEAYWWVAFWQKRALPCDVVVAAFVASRPKITCRLRFSLSARHILKWNGTFHSDTVVVVDRVSEEIGHGCDSDGIRKASSSLSFVNVLPNGSELPRHRPLSTRASIDEETHKTIDYMPTYIMRK